MPQTRTTASTLAAALTASALVLAGMLAVQLGSRASLPTAGADMVLQTQGVTFLTARTLIDEDSLFVIDPVTRSLLVYGIDLRTEGLELIGGQRLDRLFAQAVPDGVLPPGADDDSDAGN